MFKGSAACQGQLLWFSSIEKSIEYKISSQPFPFVGLCQDASACQYELTSKESEL